LSSKIGVESKHDNYDLATLLIRGSDRALIGRDLGAFTPSAPEQLGAIRALVNSVRIDQ